MNERSMMTRRSSTTAPRISTTTPAPPAPSPAVPQLRLRDVGRRHVEATLSEVAPTIRRIRHLLTVVAVCVPIAVIGGLALLWRLAS
jgi:hypothetical protein